MGTGSWRRNVGQGGTSNSSAPWSAQCPRLDHLSGTIRSKRFAAGTIELRRAGKLQMAEGCQMEAVANHEKLAMLSTVTV